MKTAKEVRELAEAVKTELPLILKRDILDRAKEGFFSVNYFNRLSKEQIKILEDLGYILTVETSIKLGEVFYVISW